MTVHRSARTHGPNPAERRIAKIVDWTLHVSSGRADQPRGGPFCPPFYFR